jgi:hypothetical protein
VLAVTGGVPDVGHRVCTAREVERAAAHGDDLIERRQHRSGVVGGAVALGPVILDGDALAQLVLDRARDGFRAGRIVGLVQRRAPYCTLIIRIPAALAAVAAARVAVGLGAPFSAPSERTIIIGVAEGLWRLPVSSACAAAIPEPMYEVPPAMMLSNTVIAWAVFVVKTWSRSLTA